LLEFARAGTGGMVKRLHLGRASESGVLAASLVLYLARDDRVLINRIVNVSLSGALCFSSIAIALGDGIRRFYLSGSGRESRIETLANWTRRHRTALVVILGGMVGVIVPLSSVGAGAVAVAVLMLLFPSIAPREIVGTDIAHGVLLAAIAGLGHLFLRNVDFRVLSSLLIGMLPGVFLGGLLAGYLSETLLRPIISVALLGAAVKLFVV
jgi:hypothetical protein